MNQSVDEFLREYIKFGDTHLDDETRAIYFKALDNMRDGKYDSADEIEEFSQYLEEQVNMLEEQALEDRDTEGVNKLAELRNAQTELKMAMWMIEPTEKAPVKDPTQQVLDKIAQVATATA